MSGLVEQIIKGVNGALTKKLGPGENILSSGMKIRLDADDTRVVSRVRRSSIKRASTKADEGMGNKDGTFYINFEKLDDPKDPDWLTIELDQPFKLRASNKATGSDLFEVDRNIPANLPWYIKNPGWKVLEITPLDYPANLKYTPAKLPFGTQNLMDSKRVIIEGSKEKATLDFLMPAGGTTTITFDPWAAADTGISGSGVPITVAAAVTIRRKPRNIMIRTPSIANLGGTVTIRINGNQVTVSDTAIALAERIYAGNAVTFDGIGVHEIIITAAAGVNVVVSAW